MVTKIDSVQRKKQEQVETRRLIEVLDINNPQTTINLEA